MSISTHLFIGNRWTIEDIAKTIQSVRKEQIEKDGKGFKVESCHRTAIGMFQFFFEGRMMFVHSGSETPLGRFTLLSLGGNNHAIEIMESIANVLGGLLEKNDCDGQLEFIRGKLCDDDGLQYHLKYAIIYNDLEYDDIEGLRESVDKWNKRHKL